MTCGVRMTTRQTIQTFWHRGIKHWLMGIYYGPSRTIIRIGNIQRHRELMETYEIRMGWRLMIYDPQ